MGWVVVEVVKTFDAIAERLETLDAFRYPKIKA